ncbi:hemerythrin domain-containing protein [Variovorax sp. dw_308]|uniref:hemerythrin domain-containing protein n=1 Tax=Variovorax sp. dw_308 TaxID=2721546 RepID=UPI001C43EBEE|nr:hemerythrin domain-containing protein [Variovorax sp. dw_308]
MKSLITRWHADHVHFSRLLDLLKRQVAEFHDDGEPDYNLMLDIVSYLREYGDRVHHPLEDEAFELLVLRAPELRLPVNRLKQEHRAIAIAGEELVGLLNGIIGDAVIARDKVEAAAALYLAYYRHHLATEERDILPRAARLLDEHDWKSVARSVPPLLDPLFGTVQGTGYRNLRDALNQHA